jgi:hypothetical protein
MQDATAAFQAALDAASEAGGAIVAVPAGLYRIDGQLTVDASRVVLRGVGAAQSGCGSRASRGMSYKSHLNFAGALKLADEALLTADGEARSATITVADAGAYKVGDDVAVGFVITPEFIAEHAMTGTWMVFNDAWQSFFWRTVVAVEGDTLTLDVPLRYPAKLRDQASVQRVSGYLREVGVEDLGLANAVGWDDAWAQEQVHALSLRGVKDAWVRGVASFRRRARRRGPGEGAAPAVGRDRGRASKRVTIADSTLALARGPRRRRQRIPVRGEPEQRGAGARLRRRRGAPQLHPELGLRRDGHRVAADPQLERRGGGGEGPRLRADRAVGVPPFAGDGEPDRSEHGRRRLGRGQPQRGEQRRGAQLDAERGVEPGRRRGWCARASSATAM